MGSVRRPQHAGLFHVMTRSVAEERIFRSVDDYAAGIGILADLVRKELLVCHAFCFMPTHYHALASFEENRMPMAMHGLNRRYAIGFNRRHARRGHVFDGPYNSVEVVTESHLIWLSPYIANNPSRRPWPYSSFDADFSFVDPTPLIEPFGSEERWRDYAAAHP